MTTTGCKAVWRNACVLLAGVFAIGGCADRPSAIRHPRINAEAAAAGAIEQFDEDGDALLSPEELVACPGVLSKLSATDADGDGALSADEIAARIRYWQRDSTARVMPRVIVLMGNQPLSGAQVELSPEPFLEGTLRPGLGKTGQSGAAAISIPDTNPPGVACGWYRVRVTHPEQEIPAEFNAATTLGLEVNADTAVSWDPIIFRIEVPKAG